MLVWLCHQKCMMVLVHLANFESIQFECAGESCQIGAFVSSVDTNLCQVGFQEMIDHVELLNIMCR